MSKSPGIVLVNTFCDASDKHFSGYVGYMDRPAAVRRSHIKDYDIFSEYMNYMGNPIKTKEVSFENPEKISGLFTDHTDLASADEIASLKDEFRIAQENGSLMWQTVISFQNDWLEKMHLYDSKTGILDEKRLKNAARSSINRLLEKEELTDAVWSAAIHYNTDNIHIHIGMVEPKLQRRRKLYPQYEKKQVSGKWQYKREQDPETGIWHRVPILNEQGEIQMKEEYVGKFKESSLKAAKSALLESLSKSQEINREINEIIRERILKALKEDSLYEDEAFQEAFVALCRKLPENKGICNYGNPVMEPLRQEIDEISNLYLEKCCRETFEDLKEKLYRQEAFYQAAYGESENHFAENKLQDLYYRMGNAILKSARNYDVPMEAERKQDSESHHLDMDLLKNLAETGNPKALYQLGKIYLRQSEDREDIELGTYYMLQSAEKGHSNAQYEMGKLAGKAGKNEEAKKWYAASAAQGNAYAAKALNNMNKPVDWTRSMRQSLAKNKEDLRSALVWLKRSLDYEYERYLNLQDYEKLQRSIDENTELEL